MSELDKIQRLLRSLVKVLDGRVDANEADQDKFDRPWDRFKVANTDQANAIAHARVQTLKKSNL